MKQYPYSDSTDVVIYNNDNNKKKDKKNRKPKTWVVAVSCGIGSQHIHCWNNIWSGRSDRQ